MALFPKSFLQDVINSDDVVEERIVYLRETTSFHEAVFKYDGKLFLTTYQLPLIDDVRYEYIPYEDEPNMVECIEVVPADVVVTKYIPVN